MSESALSVLVLGDAGVGKSSLIATVVAGTFTTPAEHVLLDQRLASAVPPLDDAAPALTLHLIDSAAADEDPELLNKIRFADALLFAYDAQPSRLATLANISSWLELASSVTDLASKVVLLVGLKAEEEQTAREVSLCTQLLLEHPCVIEAVRCSALRGDAGKALERAEMNHLYPTAPLFDVTRRAFTDRGYRAFKRVFRLYDLDADGLLCEAELQSLHAVYQSTRLSGEELRQLLGVVRSDCPLGVRDDALTLDGLLALLAMFVERHQTHMLWRLLRRHDYSDAVDIEAPETLDLPACAPGERLALSAAAEHFLSRIAAYTAASCGSAALGADCLESVFSVLGPEARLSVPWLRRSYPLYRCASGALLSLAPPDSQGLSNAMWVAQWHALMHVDPCLCCQLLYLLGFDGREDAGAAAVTVLRLPSAAAVLASLLGETIEGMRHLLVLVVAQPVLASLATHVDAAAESAGVLSCSTIAGSGRLPVSITYSFQRPRDGLDASQFDVVVLPFSSDFHEAARIDRSLPPRVPRLFMCVGVERGADMGAALRFLAAHGQDHPFMPGHKQPCQPADLDQAVVAIAEASGRAVAYWRTHVQRAGVVAGSVLVLGLLVLISKSRSKLWR